MPLRFPLLKVPLVGPMASRLPARSVSGAEETVPPGPAVGIEPDSTAPLLPTLPQQVGAYLVGPEPFTVRSVMVDLYRQDDLVTPIATIPAVVTNAVNSTRVRVVYPWTPPPLDPDTDSQTYYTVYGVTYGDGAEDTFLLPLVVSATQESTFDPRLQSARDVARFFIPDMDLSCAVFSDAELDGLLTVAFPSCTDPYGESALAWCDAQQRSVQGLTVASMAWEVIAGSRTRTMRAEQLGLFKIDDSSKVKAAQGRASELRLRALSLQSGSVGASDGYYETQVGVPPKRAPQDRFALPAYVYRGWRWHSGWEDWIPA